MQTRKKQRCKQGKSKYANKKKAKMLTRKKKQRCKQGQCRNETRKKQRCKQEKGKYANKGQSKDGHKAHNEIDGI